MDISLDELRAAIVEGNKGLEVGEMFRLKKRRVVDGRSVWDDGETVGLHFIGRSIPDYIYVWRARIQVAPFVDPVRLCYSCGEEGHIQRNCKKKPRCLHCGLDRHLEAGEKCEGQAKCINCGGGHKTLDRSCPVYKKAEEINRIMAYDNLPYILARRVFENNTNHLRVPERTETNFPPLPSGTGSATARPEPAGFDHKTQGSYGNSRPWNQAASSVNGVGPRRKNHRPPDLDPGGMASFVDGLPYETQRNLRLFTEVLASAPDAALLIERIWKTIELHLKVKNGQS